MSDGDSIPQHALERLKGLRGAGNPDGVFTSDFSVNEFLLVRKAGFEPVGLCVGSCIYHLGVQYGRWTKNEELTTISQAMYHARQLAMTRMEEEADQLGADGIVGVRLDIGRYEWGQSMAEFIAIGTAVWSLLTGASGLAQNYTQLFISRLGVGLGEATCAPADRSSSFARNCRGLSPSAARSLRPIPTAPATTF